MRKKKMVSVTIELDRDVLWWLFNEAHRQDITLNQLVNDILLKELKKHDVVVNKVK